MVILDGIIRIVQIEETMCLVGISFPVLIVGCQCEITGFDGFVYLFLDKVTFHQSHPVGRVEWRFVNEFIVIDDG